MQSTLHGAAPRYTLGVTPPEPFRIVRDPAPTLHGRAAEDLRFIRSTMESAGSFTAVPGKGGVAMGAVGCAAAALASQQANGVAWLTTWLAGAAIAFVIGVFALVRKARAAGTPMARGIGAKFARTLCPPLVAGALLTLAFALAGSFAVLPGVWLLLYGTALMAAGSLSVRVVRWMGACFMVFGAIALLSPARFGDLWMALGFGGLHVAFGSIIWRNNGG